MCFWLRNTYTPCKELWDTTYSSIGFIKASCYTLRASHIVASVVSDKPNYTLSEIRWMINRIHKQKIISSHISRSAHCLDYCRLQCLTWWLRLAIFLTSACFALFHATLSRNIFDRCSELKHGCNDQQQCCLPVSPTASVPSVLFLSCFLSMSSHIWVLLMMVYVSLVCLQLCLLEGGQVKGHYLDRISLLRKIKHISGCHTHCTL